MAEGDGGGAGAIPLGSETSQGGNLRNAFPNYTGSSIDTSQHRRGVDAGVGEGKGTIPSNSSGIVGRDRNLVDSVRESGLVSYRSDSGASGSVGRGESDTNNDAAEDEKRVARSEKRATHSSLLFPLSYQGAQGLAADVRYYGKWMREQALEQIGHLYPTVKAVRQEDGSYRHATEAETQEPKSKVEELTVIAWLWARTVKCPNPACGCQMPLVRSFQLSTKKGKEAWVEPVVGKREEGTGNSDDPVPSSLSSVPSIRFVVKSGKGKAPDGTVSRKGARCLACEQPVALDHVRTEGKAGRMGAQLMAIVAEGQKGRVYLEPTEEQEAIANSAQPEWKPETELICKSGVINAPLYGMTKHADLFTSRQLVALTTFSDLVGEAKEKAIQDAVVAGLPDDDVPLNDGGTGARAYGEAIATYLAFTVDKVADRNSTIATWASNREHARNTFTRQAVAMTWDFAESNIFSDSSGNYEGGVNTIYEILNSLQAAEETGLATQISATDINFQTKSLISTDPPYYDAVPYADLSDFFYTWIRSSIGSIYPDIFSTLLVPKAQEMVADNFRHGSKSKAKEFFEDSLIKVFHRANQLNHHDYPLTVYYALKQTETDDSAQVASTGWETILEGLMQSDFSIGGTWPMRTELARRMRGQASNALASSIVLVCRPRPIDAPKTTRRQFLTELKRQLPKALKTLQQGNIAPVDLAQASIGPGMAVFSQYTAVLENDGSPMRVRTALQLINQVLDEFLTEQEGEFDGDTRWALTWFEQYQFEPGQYGDAETLSKAKNTSVSGMVDAGILEAKGGKVRLLKREELKSLRDRAALFGRKPPKHARSDWNPGNDSRMPDWEVTQYLIRELDQKGETGAAEMLAKLGDRGETARDLAYRLYSLCDRKGWAQEGIAYNSLVISWPEINRLASEVKSNEPIQPSLL